MSSTQYAVGDRYRKLNVNHAAVRMATCGLCGRRRKLPHVCFLAVSAGVLKVAIVTKAPKKCSVIYILHSLGDENRFAENLRDEKETSVMIIRLQMMTGRLVRDKGTERSGIEYE